MRCLLLCDASRPERVVETCRRLALGIEVQAFYHPDALADRALLEETAERVAGLPLIAVHGPFGDLQPGSFDPLVRETARRRVEEGLDVALRLGARHVVFHHGRVPRAGPLERWVERSAAFWGEVLGRVPADVHLHLENLLEEGPEVLCALVDRVASPRIHANLDVGHAHCNSRTPVVEWVEALGDRIGYVHLHDNHGDQDEHIGLGEGTLPVPDVLQALEHHAPEAIWAIEAEGDGLHRSLAWLEGHGFAVGGAQGGGAHRDG